MKTAILFCGFLPFNCNKYGGVYDKYISIDKWISNIFSLNDCDIFIHTWNASDEHVQLINDKFKPKRFLNDSLVHTDPLYSRSLSIKKVNELVNDYIKQTNASYDLCFLSRMDIIWCKPFILSEVFDTSKFTVSYWGKLDIDKNVSFNTPYANGQYGTHDIFFASNKTNMDIFCTVYDKLDTYISNNIYPHAHTVFRHHIEKEGLIDSIDFQLIIGLDLILESRCYMPDTVESKRFKELNFHES